MSRRSDVRWLLSWVGGLRVVSFYNVLSVVDAAGWEVAGVFTFPLEVMIPPWILVFGGYGLPWALLWVVRFSLAPASGCCNGSVAINPTYSYIRRPKDLP